MNHHLIAFALSQPWALRPEVMAAYAAVLARRVAVKEGIAQRPPRAMEDDDHEPSGPTTVMSKVGGGETRGGSIAVIPIRGTIVQRADQLGLCEGGTSTEDISQALRMAMADSSVGQVLLHIHSPGGSVYGVQELGDEICEARKEKPIVAFASSLAASAAYWIGASASEFYVTPGGEVGSIGVWSAHQNIKGYLEKEGVDIKLISAGKFKVEGHPYDALSDEAMAFMQSRIDDYYAAFTSAVAKGRNVPVAQVRDGMGQGRVLGAKSALAEGMVDGIMTMDDIVRKMQRDAKSGRRSGRSAQANRNELELLSL
ncbi:MAG TPA: signal peptide peptidase SppA [Noviherbaspirillum sp.]|nr:signal peptide peptidase SppA [Noviherbaspirillum sp.]